MINIEDQERLFKNVGNRLKKKILVYAIGGTAMMFKGLKKETLDIDMVFDKEEDRKKIIEALEDIGYKSMNPVEVYGKKDNQPKMFTFGSERFDLFLKEIIYFVYSSGMKDRAEDAHEFGNLIVRVTDPHDIILFKCATDREKDKDDVLSILRNVKVDWNIVVKEAEEQVKLGKDKAVFELGYFLEDLSEEGVKIPKKILDELFGFVEKQIKEKRS